MSWKQLARQLPFGSKRKVNCCGTSPSTYIRNERAGISIGPCFRCGTREFEAHSGISAADYLRWTTADAEVRGMQTLPTLAPVHEWPTDVLVWLGKAGISTEQASSLGAGYHRGTDRFYLPCKIDGKSTGHFTGRAVPRVCPSSAGRRPKYIAGGRGLPVWAGCLAKPAWPGSENLAVVVEDILSAWKVAQSGFRGAAILGTSIDQIALGGALRGAAGVVSWFDPDPAGDAAHKKLRRALGLWDLPQYRVQSEHDPKNHSRDEIRNYIKEKIAHGGRS